MSHGPRNIVVDNEAYEWVLRKNSLLADGNRHIAVYSPSAKGQTLYLDPYAWEFEVRPKTIAAAVRFALGIGWTPNSPAPPLYLGFRDGEFFRMTEGVRFARDEQKD